LLRKPIYATSQTGKSEAGFAPRHPANEHAELNNISKKQQAEQPGRFYASGMANTENCYELRGC